MYYIYDVHDTRGSAHSAASSLHYNRFIKEKPNPFQDRELTQGPTHHLSGILQGTHIDGLFGYWPADLPHRQELNGIGNMLRLHMFSNGMSILMCIKRLCGNFQDVMTKQRQLMVLVICINTHF